MGCKAFIPHLFVHLTHTYRFRWVDCQLAYLADCFPGGIQEILNGLPATLNETYERTLREIKEKKRESAQRLLVCVTVASCPLRVEELAEILAFEFKSGAMPKFHEDWRLKNLVDAVLSACSTLLSVVKVETSLGTSRVIQFAHFTVKEFLTSSRFAENHDSISRRYHISMSPAHTFVAQACLGMLLHLNKNITSWSLTQFPLAEYAAQHWFEHARFEDLSHHATMEGMRQLFDRTKSHLSIWLWIDDPTVSYWERRERAEGPSPPCGTPLHYAAFCGLHDIVKILAIEHPQDVNSRCIDDASSPLHLASRGGHVGLARMLVEHGADVSAQNKDRLTHILLFHLSPPSPVCRLPRSPLLSPRLPTPTQSLMSSTSSVLACYDLPLKFSLPSSSSATSPPFAVPRSNPEPSPTIIFPSALPNLSPLQPAQPPVQPPDQPLDMSSHQSYLLPKYHSSPPEPLPYQEAHMPFSAIEPRLPTPPIPWS